MRSKSPEAGLCVESGLRVKSRWGRRARRGFTAVELTVAVTAGLMVAAAAFTLAKTSTEVFQQEARMNAAQFSNLLGMDRLTADIKRAGFQTSPDPSGDPSVCSPPATAKLKEFLTAVRIYEGKTDSTSDYATKTYGTGYPAHNVVLAENNRAPDRLRLVGNYATSERFKIGLVDQTTGKVGIEVDQLPVQRIFADKDNTGGFCVYFPNDSMVRIQDQAGLTRFAPVTGCDDTAQSGSNYTQLIVTVDVAAFVGGSCSEPSGGYINPLSMVEYFLVRANDLTTYGFPTGVATIGGEDVGLAAITGEASRMMMIRREIDSTGATLGMPEIVSDYAVDLNVRARYAEPAPTATPAFTLADQDFDAMADVPPNQLRTLGVRLTTRARNPDRSDGPATPPASNIALARFKVFAASDTASTTNKFQFARVRTLYADVNMPNMANHIPW